MVGEGIMSNGDDDQSPTRRQQLFVAAEPDAHDEWLIDLAFPTAADASPEVTRRVLAAIPSEVFAASPEEFSNFLEGLFLTEQELDAALDRVLVPGTPGEGIHLARRVRALVPAEVLETSDTAGFIDQVFDVFDEIDEVLAAFAETTSSRHAVGGQAPTAIVPEEVIADPLELIRAVDRLESEAQKFSVLFRQARHALRSLRAYRLTKRSPGQVLAEIKSANHLPALQYVVDFLSSIQQAATSFEKLELPKPHIRDYLEYLYRMEDWASMADLVSRLEKAVLRYLDE